MWGSRKTSWDGTANKKLLTIEKCLLRLKRLLIKSVSHLRKTISFLVYNVLVLCECVVKWLAKASCFVFHFSQTNKEKETFFFLNNKWSKRWCKRGWRRGQSLNDILSNLSAEFALNKNSITFHFSKRLVNQFNIGTLEYSKIEFN